MHSLSEFATSFQTDRHEEKKVMIFTVDGGPDENPRYGKTINCSTKYFVENGLDAFFLVTNATGRSAFNRVKRRMNELCKELVVLFLNMINLGVILMQKV